MEPESTNTIMFPVQYFKELPQLNKLLKETEEEVQPLIGPLKIMVATKKGVSIGNRVMKNSAIGRPSGEHFEQEGDWTQKCGARGCKTCTHMGKGGDKLSINGQNLTVPPRFNCKTKNCIYLARCKLCSSLREEGSVTGMEDTYFGQTIQ